MEKFHPFLYLGFVPGFDDFPNIVYSWAVMAFLIAVSVLATRSLQTIPVGLFGVAFTCSKSVLFIRAVVGVMVDVSTSDMVMAHQTVL